MYMSRQQLGLVIAPPSGVHAIGPIAYKPPVAVPAPPPVSSPIVTATPTLPTPSPVAPVVPAQLPQGGPITVAGIPIGYLIGGGIVLFVFLSPKGRR